MSLSGQLMREFGAPETQATTIAGGSSFTADFLYRRQHTIIYREQHAVIETGGKGKYEQKKDLLKQLERDRLLRDAGYKAVRVTWDEVFCRPRGD